MPLVGIPAVGMTEEEYSRVTYDLTLSVTTTEQLGKAMISVARSGSAKRVLETPDINSVSG